MPDIEEILDSVEDFSKVGYKNGEEQIPYFSNLQQDMGDIIPTDCTVDVNLNQIDNSMGWENNQPLYNKLAIQEALDNANYGDVICLPSGRFAIGGSIHINNSGVTLTGSDGFNTENFIDPNPYELFPDELRYYIYPPGVWELIEQDYYVGAQESYQGSNPPTLRATDYTADKTCQLLGWFRAKTYTKINESHPSSTGGGMGEPPYQAYGPLYYDPPNNPESGELGQWHVWTYGTSSDRIVTLTCTNQGDSNPDELESTELWFYERNEETEYRCECGSSEDILLDCVVGYFNCSHATDGYECESQSEGCEWGIHSKYINNVGPSEGIIIGTDNLQSIEKYNSSVVASSDDPNYIVLNLDADAFLEVGDEIIIEVFVNQNFVDFYDMSYLSSPTGNIENNETTDGWDTGWKNFTKRKISYIQNNLIYLDIPLRYEISPNTFSHLRIKKLTNYSTDIGLQDIKVSNSIYYDDAWKKDSFGDYLSDGLNLITMQNCIDCFIDNVDSQDIASYFYEWGLPEIGRASIDVYTPGASIDALLGRSTCPPQGIMTKIISKMGETLLEELGEDWFGDDLYSGDYIECSRDLRLFDFVLNNMGVGSNNNQSHTRYILSNGIKVENSKNITIQNSTMSDAELRIEGDNGKMFYINNSNEVLIENCGGYRGRHNFSVGGWGTSGIVFNKIWSSEGWGFGFTDTLFDQLGLTDNIPTQLKEYSLNGTLTKHGILKNNKITEASGIVHSRQYDNVFWTHNDSSGQGATNSIFAFNTDGDDLGEFFLTGEGMITQRDWEDMATDNDGNLYIGEIGDNNHSYQYKYIYKCPEPDVNNPGNYTISCESYKFIYESEENDMPDSETLMVDFDGDIYIVTKSDQSSETPSSIFELNVNGLSTTENNVATLVGEMTLLPGIGLLNQVTGGDISSDGGNILIRTYEKIFNYLRSTGDSIADALQVSPTLIGFEPTTSSVEVAYTGELLEQAEAVAWSSDGNGYYTISEEKTPSSVIIDYLGRELGIPLKSVFDSDSDFWSRYGNIEIPSLIFGMPTYSNTSKAFSNSILVTDSTLHDGWMSANNETIDNNQGITTTNTVFWNNNAFPLISFQPKSHNDSFPYENGGLIYGDDNINLYNDVENPYEYLENWTNQISSWLGNTESQDYQNNIFNIGESLISPVMGEIVKKIDWTAALFEIYNEPCVGEYPDPDDGICIKEIADHQAILVQLLIGGTYEVGIWAMDILDDVEFDIIMCNNFNITDENHQCFELEPFTFIVDATIHDLWFKIAWEGTWLPGSLSLQDDNVTLTIRETFFNMILTPTGLIGNDATTITGYTDGPEDAIYIPSNEDNIDLEGSDWVADMYTEILDEFYIIRNMAKTALSGKLEDKLTPNILELFNTGDTNYNNSYILTLISLLVHLENKHSFHMVLTILQVKVILYKQ